jgi:hypothetical protein
MTWPRASILSAAFALAACSSSSPTGPGASGGAGSGGVSSNNSGGSAGGSTTSAVGSGGTIAGGGGTVANSGGTIAGSGGKTGGSGGKVARPAYNTGTGFFVINGKLYDPDGFEFRIRGVDKCHYDAQTPGIWKIHANTIRQALPLWLDSSVSIKIMQDAIDHKSIPMGGVWFTSGKYSDTEQVTCKSDIAQFNLAVNQWVAHAQDFKPYEKYLLIDIANEWGPQNSTVWRDSYKGAIKALRDAGYLNTLVIDTGGCGQDPDDILKYGKEVFDSDPQRNILFDIHIYGLWTTPAHGLDTTWQKNFTTEFPPLANTGLPLVIGEFGPGRDVGPSPTLLSPGEVIQEAETINVGWIAWAWDDPPGQADDNWFALSYTGNYDSSADLTIFGKDVVENPTYGLLRLAQPATIFKP